MSRVCASSRVHIWVGDDRILNIYNKGLRQVPSLPWDRSATENYVVALTSQGVSLCYTVDGLTQLGLQYDTSYTQPNVVRRV